MKNIKLVSLLLLIISFLALSCEKESLEPKSRSGSNTNQTGVTPVSPTPARAIHWANVAFINMSTSQFGQLLGCMSLGDLMMVDCHGNNHLLTPPATSGVNIPFVNMELRTPNLNTAANMDDCVGQQVKIIIRIDNNCHTQVATGVLVESNDHGNPWLLLLNFNNITDFNPCYIWCRF